MIVYYTCITRFDAFIKNWSVKFNYTTDVNGNLFKCFFKSATSTVIKKFLLNHNGTANKN